MSATCQIGGKVTLGAAQRNGHLSVHAREKRDGSMKCSQCYLAIPTSQCAAHKKICLSFRKRRADPGVIEAAIASTGSHGTTSRDDPAASDSHSDTAAEPPGDASDTDSDYEEQYRTAGAHAPHNLHPFSSLHTLSCFWSAAEEDMIELDGIIEKYALVGECVAELVQFMKKLDPDRAQQLKNSKREIRKHVDVIK